MLFGTLTVTPRDDTPALALRLPGMLRLLRFGRWAILLAELLPFLIRFDELLASTNGQLLLGLVVVYNAAALWFVRKEEPLRRRAAGGLLGVDLLVITAVVNLTRGIHSDFLGLYYLVIIAAAIFYELAGGRAVAFTASVLLILGEGVTHRLTFSSSQVAQMTAWATDLVMAGVIPGYLMRELSRQVRHRERDRERLHELRVRERLVRQEMEIARQIQQASLPAELPQPEGWECAVQFSPLREVGGDFYDAFEAEGRLWLLIGDVSGKGISAALLASRISSIFPRPLRGRPLPRSTPPDQVLAALNAQLYGRVPEGVFATVLVCAVDLMTGHYEVAGAGHPPALACGPDGSGLQRGEGGLPLGLFAEVTGKLQHGALARGEALLFYTDGVTDVQAANGQRPSEAWLAGLLQECRSLPAAAQARRLAEAVWAFGTVTDDVTMLVLRCLPARVSCQSSVVSSDKGPGAPVPGDC
jgi:serine phosphatase RsbU (regulator of sigma subunit)